MYLRNVMTTVTTRVAVVLLGLVTSILTARILGPEGRGDYYFVLTFAAMVSQFSNLGFHSSNTYFLAKDPTLLSGLSANCLWLSFVLGGGLAALGAAFLIQTQWYPGVSHEFFWLGAAFAPLSLFFLLGSNILIGLNKITPYNLLQLGNALMHLGLVALAGVLGGQVQALLITAVFGFFLMSVILAAMLRKYGARQLKFDNIAFKTSNKYAFKAYVICLLGFLVLRGSIFILKRSSSSQEIGYYSVAAQIADGVGIFPQAVALVLFPNLVQNESTRWSETLKTLGIIALLLAIICGLVVFLAHPAISILFGPKFLPAVPILYYLLPGAYFLGLSAVVSQYLAAIGMPKELLVVWLLAFCLLLTGCWLWIPEYSAKGAAMASSLAHFALFGMVLALGFIYSRVSRTSVRSAPC